MGQNMPDDRSDKTNKNHSSLLFQDNHLKLAIPEEETDWKMVFFLFLLAGLSIWRLGATVYFDGDLSLGAEGGANAREVFRTKFLNPRARGGAGLVVALFFLIPVGLMGVETILNPKIWLFSITVGLSLFVVATLVTNALLEDRMRPDLIILLGQAAVIVINIPYAFNYEFELISSTMGIVLIVWVLLWVGLRFYYKAIQRLFAYVIPPADRDDMKSYEKSTYDRIARYYFPSKLRWVPNFFYYLGILAIIILAILNTWVLSFLVLAVIIYGGCMFYKEREDWNKYFVSWYEYKFKNGWRQYFCAWYDYIVTTCEAWREDCSKEFQNILPWLIGFIGTCLLCLFWDVIGGLLVAFLCYLIYKARQLFMVVYETIQHHFCTSPEPGQPGYKQLIDSSAEDVFYKVGDKHDKEVSQIVDAYEKEKLQLTHLHSDVVWPPTLVEIEEKLPVNSITLFVDEVGVMMKGNLQAPDPSFYKNPKKKVFCTAAAKWSQRELFWTTPMTFFADLRNNTTSDEHGKTVTSRRVRLVQDTK